MSKTNNLNPPKFNNKMEAIEWLIKESHVLFRSEGIKKPFDKSKWREYIAAEKLGHIVHPNASAGIQSECYGSDAFSTNKVPQEYKSKTMNPKQEQHLRRGAFNGRVSMVYNGAYKKGAIDRYKNIVHILTLFSEQTGEMIMAVQVPTSHVISQLENGMKKMTPGKTTNCNNVYVDFRNGTPVNGTILWKK